MMISQKKNAKRGIVQTLFALLLLLSADACIGATVSIQTWTLQPTNGTWYTNAITIAGKLLRFTNATTSTTILTNTSPAASATNLFNQLGGSPIIGVTVGSMTNTNTLTFKGDGLVVSVTPGWATLTSSTVVGTNLFAYPLPIDFIADLNTRTNNSSNLVYSLKYSSLPIPTNDSVASTLVTRTGNAETFANKTINSSLANGLRATNTIGLHGTNVLLHGGILRSNTIDGPISSNLVNFGAAISSPGTTNFSEQFGSNSVATGYYSLAAGPGAVAFTDYSLAVGPNTTASGYGASAFGQGATCVFSNSSAIGAFAIPNADNQMMLGSSTVNWTYVNGRLQASIGSTNLTMWGTNKIVGDLSAPLYAITTLANGNNLAVPFTNLFVALYGPSAAFSINGIYGGRDGRWIHGVNLSGQTLTLAHESGVDPTPANRIYCAPATDLTFSHGQHFDLWYNASSNRWLTWKPEATVLVTNALGTMKTNGTVVSSAVTSLDLLQPWNADWVLTNAGGVITAELRVRTNTFNGSQFTGTGTGGSNWSIKDGVLETNVNHYGAFVNNGSSSTTGLTTNSGEQNTWLTSSNINVTASNATVAPFGVKAASSATTNTAEFRDPSGYVVVGVNSNGIPFMSISNSSVQYPLLGRVFNQVGLSSCSNITTVETTWLGTGQGSLTLPANFWAVGRSVDLLARGRMWTGATPGNSAWFIKLGSQNLATNVTQAIATNLADDPWDLRATLTCWTNSASVGYIQCDGELRIWSATGGALTHTKYFKSTKPIFDITPSAALNVTSTNGAATTGIQVTQLLILMSP
jgi:hypothetical protein